MIYQVSIPIFDQLVNSSDPNDFKVATDLGEYVSDIVGFILLIASIVTFVYLVWGGLKWLTSGSDTQKVDEARSHLTNALIGLAIVACSWAVFLLIDYFLGLGVATPPPPPYTGPNR